MEECCMMLPPNSIEEKKNQQQQIQLKISTIFKQKVIDTPQALGSFYDANGEKYCAISVLSKYLGCDIAIASRNSKNTNPAELIPYDILEMIENFALYSNHKEMLCFCSKPDYYYRNSLISLLIHLNDYHKMTFNQIGNWLENIDM